MRSRWGFLKTARYWFRAVLGLTIVVAARYLPDGGWGWILVWLAVLGVGGWLVILPFFDAKSPPAARAD